ncbi:ComEA family DNA-binding protein [Erysipelotrichaceae bacterium 66-17]
MKKFLLCILLIVFFGFALAGRYEPVELSKTVSSVIQVEIKGGVNTPGVYELKRGSSLEEAIQAAGGTSEDADLSAISLTTTIEHDELIVIPARNEQTARLVSINTATSEELQTLSGIGPAMAQRIIDYRQAQPFQTLEEIKNVKGIGEKMFEKIKEHICL